MRKLLVGITAASLALSMLAQAAPASAVSGYDSSYAGESAFVNLSAGQSNEFQVFFANTGATTWTVGAGSEVDLAACMADKVTCNAQDSSDAAWNAGWKSPTRYATSTQSSVAPGAVATFKYTVTAPAGVAAGEYDFNGDLVLASTGEKIHPEGYYQAATVGTGNGAASITSLTPTSGPAGTAVTISGSGFICTPSFPAASFDTAAATVLSCGTTSITAQAPAHALGASTVTVTNSGAPASNGLSFTYTDTTKPTFASFAIAKDVLTVTFDEPVCGTYVATDWNAQNISSPGGANLAAGSTSNLPACTGTPVSSFNIFLTGTVPPGAFVETTLVNGSNTTDASSNTANAPQSRQATATAGDTTKPTLTGASGAVAQNNVTLTFSEPVYCPTVGQPAITDIVVDDTSSTSDPTVTAITGCSNSRSAAASTFTITLSQPVKASTGYTVTICGAAGNPAACGAGNATGEIADASNNALTVPASVSFTGGAADFTPPTMVDARMSNNQATTDFNDAGDAFKVTFSEKMNGVTTNAQIDAQDQDGTTGRIICGTNATCSWDTGTGGTTTILTVALTGALLAVPGGGVGSTPGMQIPFNITSIGAAAPGGQITDLQGNPPNVLGSPDRLVDFEF